jgi:hypothetical protein
MLFTGSATGLNVGSAVSRSPSCVSGRCSPYWLTPSMAHWGEPGYPSFLQLTMDSSWNNPRPADFNGDGFPDILLGGPAYLNADQTTSFVGGFYVFQ